MLYPGNSISMLLYPGPPPPSSSWSLSPAWLVRLIVPRHMWSDSCSGSRSGLYRGSFPVSCGGLSRDYRAADHALGRPAACFPQLVCSAARSEVCAAAHAVDRPGARAAARPAARCPAWCRSSFPGSCGGFSRDYQSLSSSLLLRLFTALADRYSLH